MMKRRIIRTKNKTNTDMSIINPPIGMGGISRRSSFTGGSVITKITSPIDENTLPGRQDLEKD